MIVRPALASCVEALFRPAPFAGRTQVLSAATSSQAGSLAVLVRALVRDASLLPELVLLVAPVDTLPCREATYRALRRALSACVLAATPRFEGRGGHPVLLRGPLVEAYLQGPGSRPVGRCARCSREPRSAGRASRSPMRAW